MRLTKLFILKAKQSKQTIKSSWRTAVGAPRIHFGINSLVPHEFTRTHKKRRKLTLYVNSDLLTTTLDDGARVKQRKRIRIAIGQRNLTLALILVLTLTLSHSLTISTSAPAEPLLQTIRIHHRVCVTSFFVSELHNNSSCCALDFGPYVAQG